MPAAGLVEIAPLGLPPFDILIHRSLHLHKNGSTIFIRQDQIGFEEPFIRELDFGWRQVDLITCLPQDIRRLQVQ